MLLVYVFDNLKYLEYFQLVLLGDFKGFILILLMIIDYFRQKCMYYEIRVIFGRINFVFFFVLCIRLLWS